MRKSIKRLLIAFLFVIATDAYAQDRYGSDVCSSEECCCYEENNFYAKVFGGTNFLQNTEINGNKTTYNTGYVVAGSLGYCWQYGLRVEAEYAYRRNTISKIDFYIEESAKNGHYQASSCMGNIFWDLPLSSCGCSFWDLKPYIGAGAGYDFQKMHATNSRITFDQNWNQFAWQLMAGLSYPICCNTELALEYKYHQGGTHFYNHSLGFGITYKFY